MMQTLNTIANVIITLLIVLFVGCIYLPKAAGPIGGYLLTQGQGLLFLLIVFTAVVKVIKHTHKSSH